MGPCYNASSLPKLVTGSEGLTASQRRAVPASLDAQQASEVSRRAYLGRSLIQRSNTLSSKHLEFMALDQPVLSSTTKGAEAQPEV